MESSSISFRYTRIQAYASAASPSKALPDGSGAASSAAASQKCDGQSKDGDTFTMSLEARVLQISISESGAGANATQAGDVSQNGDGSQADGNGSDLVKALMQSVKDLFGQGGVAADNGADDGSGADGAAAAGKDAADGAQGAKRHRHHHHGQEPLRGPQDVADRVLKHLEQEYAQSGGSKQDFVDDVKQRMAARSGSQGRGYGGADFRGQVNSLVTAGLDSWTKGGAASDQS